MLILFSLGTLHIDGLLEGGAEVCGTCEGIFGFVHYILHGDGALGEVCSIAFDLADSPVVHIVYHCLCGL